MIPTGKERINELNPTHDIDRIGRELGCGSDFARKVLEDSMDYDPSFKLKSNQALGEDVSCIDTEIHTSELRSVQSNFLKSRKTPNIPKSGAAIISQVEKRMAERIMADTAAGKEIPYLNRAQARWYARVFLPEQMFRTLKK